MFVVACQRDRFPSELQGRGMCILFIRERVLAIVRKKEHAVFCLIVHAIQIHYGKQGAKD